MRCPNRILLFFISVTFCFSGGLAQEIKLGYLCPDIKYSILENLKVEKISLSETRGKLVLLDLWATNCLPCVRNLKKLDSIQREFIDDIVIISATPEPAQKIIEFFGRRGERPLNLKIATDDSVSSRYFPYSVIPHFVWIDKDGKLLAITPDESVTRENIKRLVQGESVSFVLKNDLVDFDYSKPLDSESFFYRAVITGYKPGLNQMGVMPYQSRVNNRIQAFNCTIGLLYSLALEQHNLNNSRRMIIRSKDSSKLVFPKGVISRLWRQTNTYCYDLIVDSSNAINLRKLMVKNLDDYFGLRGRIEYIDTTCLVIVRTSTVEKYKHKGEKKEAYLPDESGNYNSKFLKNRPISILLQVMFNMEKNLYIIDETGIKDNISIEFTAPLDDINGLNKDFKRYDLLLIEAKRKVPFLIIEDRQ